MDFENQVDRTIEAQMQKKHIPGLALAIVKDGQVVYEQCYGLANVETGTPVTRDTAFEIASITKGFTAQGILMLRADGLLSLEDPLARFYPGLRPDWEGITLRHLLTHTSGVTPWDAFWMRNDVTPEVVCDFVFNRPLRFAHGSQWEYVDTNYNILGMVIHCLAGVPYDAFLQERVFMPLGMAHTRHND